LISDFEGKIFDQFGVIDHFSAEEGDQIEARGPIGVAAPLG